MQAMTIALALFIQQPGLPRELNISQIVTPGGAVASVATPGAQDRVPGPGQQLPAVQLELEQDAGTNPFDVLMVAADLRQVLNALAQANGLSLVMDPAIADTVDADLRGVNLEEALAVILDPRGLEYQIEGELLRVNTPQLETRTFEFDYITTERSLSRSLSASASAGGGGTTGSTAGGANVGGGGGGNSSTSISGSESTSLLTDVETDLATLISPEGRIIYNKLAGLIFVTDFRPNLEAIGTYLELIQNAVNRQVVIEARIIEVKLNDNFRAGVDWSAILGTTGTLTQSLGSAVQNGFNFSVTHGDFDALIQTLSTRGEVNVLSASSISTLNNQPAVCRTGTQDVFFTTTSQVDPDTGRTISTTTTPATINDGVVLDVTPQISSDGIITMNIHPTITERTGQATSPDGNTVPIVDVRETDTVLRVREGDTIFIAGFISDRTLEAATKVPILGDIPLIGNIFRSVELETRKTDMVILLTPTITTVQSAADYARQRLENQADLRESLD